MAKSKKAKIISKDIMSLARGYVTQKFGEILGETADIEHNCYYFELTPEGDKTRFIQIKIINETSFEELISAEVEK